MLPRRRYHKDDQDRLSNLRRDFLRFAEPFREQNCLLDLPTSQKYMDAKMLLKEERGLDAYHTLLEVCIIGDSLN